jgi:hypothetical protein
MATITLFIEEVDDTDERRQRTRKRRAAGVLVVLIAGTLAFAPRSRIKLPPPGGSEGGDKSVAVAARTYSDPIGPMPEDRRVAPAVVPPRSEPDRPLIVTVNDPTNEWPDLPSVTRTVASTATSVVTREEPQIHHCSLTPHVEPRSIHFRAPGRKRITISNPHDVAFRVERIDLAGNDVRGYALEGAEACLRPLQPAETCTFTVHASVVAGYTPAVRVDIGHATRR